MIEKVDTNQINNFLEKSSSRQPNNAVALPGNDPAVSIQVDYASFIDSALKIPQEDYLIVERAKELLLSDRLDSPDNVKTAAENMITLGI
jgi:hypothetical protein